MAGETYYYYFSLIAVFGVILYLINLLLLRTKGKTTYGLAYRKGTEEYSRVVKLASNRNLTITVILALALVANLMYDVSRLANLEDREYARTTLISAPIVTTLIFALMLAIARKQLSDNRPGKH